MTYENHDSSFSPFNLPGLLLLMVDLFTSPNTVAFLFSIANSIFFPVLFPFGNQS